LFFPVDFDYVNCAFILLSVKGCTFVEEATLCLVSSIRRPTTGVGN